MTPEQIEAVRQIIWSLIVNIGIWAILVLAAIIFYETGDAP